MKQLLELVLELIHWLPYLHYSMNYRLSKLESSMWDLFEEILKSHAIT